MAFALRAISQRANSSQPCIPGATKAFLFELSENSPSCPFTQEHCEPPVAIVVKVFCSHGGPASSKEPRSPHSGIVSSVAHSSHSTHNSGCFLSGHTGPSPPTSVRTRVLQPNWAWGPAAAHKARGAHFSWVFPPSALSRIMFAIV